jgi:hypothetical protein
VTTRGGSRHPPGLLVPSHTQSFGRGDLGGVEEARGGATSLMEKLLAGANLICEGLGAVSSAVAGSDTEASEVAVSVAAQCGRPSTVWLSGGDGLAGHGDNNGLF